MCSVFRWPWCWWLSVSSWFPLCSSFPFFLGRKSECWKNRRQKLYTCAAEKRVTFLVTIIFFSIYNFFVPLVHTCVVSSWDYIFSFLVSHYYFLSWKVSLISSILKLYLYVCACMYVRLSSNSCIIFYTLLRLLSCFFRRKLSYQDEVFW